MEFSSVARFPEKPDINIHGPNNVGEWNLYFSSEKGFKLATSLTQAELIALRNAINDHLNGKQA